METENKKTTDEKNINVVVEDTKNNSHQINLTLDILESEQKLPKIDIIQLIKYIVGKAWLISLFMGFFFAVVFAISYRNENRRPIANTGSAVAVINFGFPNAEFGLDPLGRPFNINYLRSPFVLGRALDNLELRTQGIIPENVRNNMTIQHVLSHDTINRLNLIQDFFSGDRLVELIDDMAFHPTQLVLTLYRGPGLMGLGDQDMSELLREIITQYTEFFIETYNDIGFVDIVVRHFDINEHEYLDMIMLADGTLNNMLIHTNMLSGLSNTFRSPTTGFTFPDLYSSLTLFHNIEVGRIRGLIEINNMSDDSLRQATLLDHSLITMRLREEEARSRAATALHLATEIYEPNIVFFDASFHWDEFLNRRSPLYHDFLTIVLEEETLANQIRSDIAVIEQQIERLLDESIEPNPEDVEFVQTNLPLIFDRMEEFERTINLTVYDFINLDLYRDAIIVLSPPSFIGIVNVVDTAAVILRGLIGGLIGSIISVLIVIYRFIFKVNMAQENQTG